MTSWLEFARCWRGSLAGTLVAVVAVILTWRTAARPAQPEGAAMASELVARGSQHLESGRVDLARACYLQALRANPRLLRAAEGLANMALDADQPRLAQYWFEQAMEIDPQSGTARNGLERARARADARPDGGTPALMYAAMAMCDALAMPRRAADMFEVVLRVEPNHYGALVGVARAFDMSDRRAEARDYWVRSLRVARDHHDEKTINFIQRRLTEPN